MTSIQVKKMAINLQNKIVAARYEYALTGSREKLDHYTEKSSVLSEYSKMKGYYVGVGSPS